MILNSLLQLFIFYLTDLSLYQIIKKESTRYFILHILFNTFIISICFETFIDCLLNPLHIFDKKYDDSSMLSTISVMNFHIYHLLSHIEELSVETLLHHIVGAIINPIFTIHQPIGKLPVMHNIILCGIPGCIDYILLVMMKLQMIDRMTEKKINRYLNLLIRWPFVFLSDYFYIVNIYYGNIIFSIMTFIGMCINNYNSIYFCDKVVGNYHIINEKLKYN